MLHPSFVCNKEVQSLRGFKKNILDLGIGHVVVAVLGPGSTYAEALCNILEELSLDSLPTHFWTLLTYTLLNTPYLIWVDVCTKSSRYTSSTSCNSSPAVSSHAAHVITDTVASEVSSCFLRAFQTPESIWPSSNSAHVRHVHIYTIFSRWWRLDCLFLTWANLSNRWFQVEFCIQRAISWWFQIWPSCFKLWRWYRYRWYANRIYRIFFEILWDFFKIIVVIQYWNWSDLRVLQSFDGQQNKRHRRAHCWAAGHWDEDRVVVGAQGVHDHVAKLEDLIEHVTCAAWEAAPVGEDDEQQVLASPPCVEALICQYKRNGARKESSRSSTYHSMR